MEEQQTTAEIRRKSHQARIDKALKPFHDHKQPDDVMHDQRFDMEVSRQGVDRGPVPRELVQDYADAEGRVEVVNVVKDTLYRMHREHTITEDMYDAGREFQKHFDIASFNGMKTTNMSGAAGGGMSREDFMARTKGSRDYCNKVMHMLAGDDSLMWIAVHAVLGHRQTFEQMEKTEKKHNQFWNALLQAALHILAIEYRQEKKKRQKKYA